MAHDYFSRDGKFHFWAPWSVDFMLSWWSEPPGHWRLWKALSSFLGIFFSPAGSHWDLEPVCGMLLARSCCKIWLSEWPLFLLQTELQQVLIWNEGAETALVSAGSLCEQAHVEAGSCLFGRDIFVESQMKAAMKSKPRHPHSYAETIHAVFFPSMEMFWMETSDGKDLMSP